MDFEQFKVIESRYDNRIRISSCFLAVRLDGKRFSKYCEKAGFAKPYDICMRDAMVAGVQECFKAVPGYICAYIANDEASIVYRNPSKCADRFTFDGRIQKWVSVLASAMSAGFNIYMREERGADIPLAYFDARVLVLKDRQQIEDYLSWRRLGCMRNSVNATARTKFGRAACLNKSVRELRCMLPSKRLPEWCFRGILVDKYGEVPEGASQESVRGFLDDFFVQE